MCNNYIPVYYCNNKDVIIAETGMYLLQRQGCSYCIDRDVIIAQTGMYIVFIAQTWI
jgi:hypothetical protein